MEKKGRGD